jgi:hypothetical protein
MTSVSSGIQLKLQYSGGGGSTFADVTDYQTIGDHLNSSAGRFASHDGYFSDDLLTSSYGLRYFNPVVSSDNLEDPSTIYLTTNICNGYIGSSGTFDVKILGGTIYKTDNTQVDINRTEVENDWLTFDPDNSNPSDSMFNIIKCPNGLDTGDQIGCVKIKISLEMPSIGTDDVQPTTTEICIFPPNTAMYGNNPSI